MRNENAAELQRIAGIKIFVAGTPSKKIRHGFEVDYQLELSLQSE
jgi:hypothetical protein